MTEDLLVLSALIRRELGLDFSEHLDQLSRKAFRPSCADEMCNYRGLCEAPRIRKESPSRSERIGQRRNE